MGMRLFLLFLFSMMLCVADTKHPDRLEKVKKDLLDQGMTLERISAIFESSKAKEVDLKAVKLISDMSRIKKHRKAEKSANASLLLKSALLKKHLKKYECFYDQVEEDFSVNREIVAAILQKETALGAFKNYKYDAFVVLINMLDRLELIDNPTPRHISRHKRLVEFAHNNLVALILHYEKIGLDVTKVSLPSSYAGAMGIPQFTPQHFDMIEAPKGEKLCDISFMPTAIYSTANLLKNRFEWKDMLDFSKLGRLDEIISMWYDFDKGQANFVYDKNLDGIMVPNFVKTYEEDKDIAYVGEVVKVLMRYNFSTAYALGIIKIAKKSHE